MTAEISERRRREVVSALRGGTVPQTGLDVLAVGLGRFEQAIDEELDAVAAGGAVIGAAEASHQVELCSFEGIVPKTSDWRALGGAMGQASPKAVQSESV